MEYLCLDRVSTQSNYLTEYDEIVGRALKFHSRLVVIVSLLQIPSRQFGS